MTSLYPLCCQIIPCLLSSWTPSLVSPLSTSIYLSFFLSFPSSPLPSLLHLFLPFFTYSFPSSPLPSLLHLFLPFFTYSLPSSPIPASLLNVSYLCSQSRLLWVSSTRQAILSNGQQHHCQSHNVISHSIFLIENKIQYHHINNGIIIQRFETIWLIQSSSHTGIIDY